MASLATIPAYMSSGVPVFQPTHLDGDASLATEILPGPPSLVSIQQSLLKRDPRKPSVTFSYLPPSDPGSTYSGIIHGTLIGHEPDIARLRRSKPATGRAQRASARQLTGTVAVVDPPTESEVSLSLNPSADSEPCSIVIDDDSSISRSNSFQNMQEGSSPSLIGRPKRRDKGKAKEVEHTSLRIKEEPRVVSLLGPDGQTTNLGNNDDHCSSCRSFGALVYCDGCPRAFHLWCLDPPMESVDEGDSRWFCPSCMIRKHPPRKPPASFFSPLILQLDTSIPTEFQLPEDIRTCFREVATGPRGNYVDSSETKQIRLNRFGEQEGRDLHRLKDRNSVPILCFRCGTSALPDGLAAAVPSAKRTRGSISSTRKATNHNTWKTIISCDYCSLHWHLDCLDPPLSSIPSFTKKWMCPNHADKVFPHKRRIPKQSAPPMEVNGPGQFNNGNIDIMNAEPCRPMIIPPVPVDEVLINGRRYRVPERVVVLDFWNKLNKSEHVLDKYSQFVSGMSSPLTSLSSLEDLEEQPYPENAEFPCDNDDLKVAQVLWSLQTAKDCMSAISLTDDISPKLVDSAVQTDQVPSVRSVPTRGRAVRLPKAVPAPKVKPSSSKLSTTNGSSRMLNVNDLAVSPLDVPLPSKRKRQAPLAQRQGAGRDLRSRSKNNVDSSLTSLSSRSSMKRAEDSVGPDLPATAPPVVPVVTKRSVHIKVEETEGIIPRDNLVAEPGSVTQTPAKPREKLLEATREAKEKKGRKRKLMDDELPEFDSYETCEQAIDYSKKRRKPRGIRKVVQVASGAGPGSPLTPAITTTPSAPTTPSLKIRLPRMNTAGMSSVNGSISVRL